MLYFIIQFKVLSNMHCDFFTHSSLKNILPIFIVSTFLLKFSILSFFIEHIEHLYLKFLSASPHVLISYKSVFIVAFFSIDPTS